MIQQPIQNQDVNDANKLDNLADTVTNNVTNTYSKVFGDPAQNQRPNVPSNIKDSKILQNRKIEATPLKGATEKLENITSMLDTIAENLSDKNSNKKEDTSELNLQKFASFFKNNDQNNIQSKNPLNASGILAQKISTIIPKKEEESKVRNNTPTYSSRFQNIFAKKDYKGSVEPIKPKTYDSNVDSNEPTAIREKVSDSQNQSFNPSTESNRQTTENPNVKSNMSNDAMTKYLQSVALMESGGKSDAKASTSSASGLFQFTKGTWEEISKRMGKDWKEQDRFDPQKSTQAAEYLTNLNKSQIEKATGKEATAKDLYMGHFLGGGGASKFLSEMNKNPSRSAAEVAGEAAAQANKSIFYKQNGSERSLQEVYDLMGKKMEKAQASIESGKVGRQNLPETVANIRSQREQQTELARAEQRLQPTQLAQPEQMPQTQQVAQAEQRTQSTTAIPEMNKPEPVAAEMQQQSQRQTGPVLTTMALDQQTTRDQMNQSQAPIINNIASGGGGGGMQSPPQSSAANAPVSSVRNEENSLIRVQNMMAMQSMS